MGSIKTKHFLIWIWLIPGTLLHSQTNTFKEIKPNFIYQNSDISVIRVHEDFLVFCSTLSQDFFQNPNPDSESITDLLLLRISNEGQIIWEYRFGKPGEDYSLDLVKTNDGGWITMSAFYKGYERKTLFVKFDSFGKVEWERETDKVEECFSIVELQDSQIYILNKIYPPGILPRYSYHLVLENLDPSNLMKNQMILDTIIWKNVCKLLTNGHELYLTNSRWESVEKSTGISYFFQKDKFRDLYSFSISRLQLGKKIPWSCSLNTNCDTRAVTILSDSLIFFSGYYSNKEMDLLSFSCIRKDGQQLFLKIIDTLHFNSMIHQSRLLNSNFNLALSSAGIIHYYQISSNGDIECKKSIRNDALVLFYPRFFENKNNFLIFCKAKDKIMKYPGYSLYTIKVTN